VNHKDRAVKIRRLLVSSFVAFTAVLGASYGAFEYWVNLKANTLPKAVTQAKLTEMTVADLNQITSLANLLTQSPFPWDHDHAERFRALLEVTDAAQQTFSNRKVNQLQVGHLLTLQQEMENYVRRYPDQPYTTGLQQELPSIRSMITFFPIIKSSAGERSVDSALRAARRGATLAALVIRKAPDLVADNPTPSTAPVVAWSKAENDVLYDYSQALQMAERSRLGNDERLKIGKQVCTWLNGGQGYWGIRSLFDGQYKTQVAGDYSHNRDVYIRFSTERLCPQYTASLIAPANPTQIAQAAVNSQPVSSTPRWTAPYRQNYPTPYAAGGPMTAPGDVVPDAPFPGGIR
jgi:hypothetical protein